MKKSLFLIALMFFLNHIHAQTFQKTFGTSGPDYVKDVIQTTDKGYAVMGVMGFDGVYILKTDSLGNKIWSKNYALNTPPPEELNTFMQTTDGGYIFSGSINYSSNNYSFVVKTDSLGNIIWSKMHVALAQIFGIKQTIEGDYIALGYQYFGTKSALVRFNSSGNVVWSRILPVGDNALDVLQLASDSSFIVCCSRNSIQNITISRFSKNANLIWSKIVNTPAIRTSVGYGHLHENINDVQIAMNFSNNCSGIISVNKNGLGAKIIGMSCQEEYEYLLSDAIPIMNKGSLLVGQYNVVAVGYGTRDIVLASIDSLGTLKWAKQIGGINDETSRSIKQTEDKGIAIAGSTKSFSNGYDDIYLIKTDSLGQSGCNTIGITFSTTTLPVTLSNYTVLADSLFNNVTSMQNVSISNPSEVSYNACGCISPVANFIPNEFSMNDKSTWVDKWYWTCTCIAGVDSVSMMNKSYYDIIPNGTYTVCLKVKNSCGIDSLCQPFSYMFNPVNIDEKIKNQLSHIYPNPFHDSLIISREDNNVNMNAFQVRIINSMGVLVYSDKMEGTQKEFYLNELVPGLYFIQFYLNDKVVSRKLVKE